MRENLEHGKSYLTVDGVILIKLKGGAKDVGIEVRHGWTACYVKEVNQMEETLRFYQGQTD